MNSVPFYEALEDCSRLAGKVPQASCLPNGEIPVIGQGKRPVEGFTNDYGLLFSGALPVILFGDHTAAFKLIDHPFARGADGTKLFRPRDLRLDAKFAWHFLQTVQLPQTGYDRKTKYLEGIEIPLPLLEEQRRIAAILDKASGLAAFQQRRISVLRDIEASLLLKMTAEASCAVHTCALRDLTSYGDKINYGVVQPGDYFEGGAPLIRVGDLACGRVDRASIKYINPEIEASYSRSRIKGHELLVSCVGSIGVIAEVGPDDVGSNIARAVARVPVSESVNRKWLAAYLRSASVQRYFVNELRTVSQPTLNIKQIEETTIHLPAIELQNAFSKKLNSILRVNERSVFSTKFSNDLIASLRSMAFSGGV